MSDHAGAAGSPPPGWYGDAAGFVRWWDGGACGRHPVAVGFVRGSAPGPEGR